MCPPSVGRRARDASDAEEKNRTVVRNPGTKRASGVGVSVTGASSPTGGPGAPNLAVGSLERARGVKMGACVHPGRATSLS